MLLRMTASNRQQTKSVIENSCTEWQTNCYGQTVLEMEQSSRRTGSKDRSFIILLQENNTSTRCVNLKQCLLYVVWCSLFGHKYINSLIQIHTVVLCHTEQPNMQDLNKQCYFKPVDWKLKRGKQCEFKARPWQTLGVHSQNRIFQYKQVRQEVMRENISMFSTNSEWQIFVQQIVTEKNIDAATFGQEQKGEGFWRKEEGLLLTPGSTITLTTGMAADLKTKSLRLIWVRLTIYHNITAC